MDNVGTRRSCLPYSNEFKLELQAAKSYQSVMSICKSSLLQFCKMEHPDVGHLGYFAKWATTINFGRCANVKYERRCNRCQGRESRIAQQAKTPVRLVAPALRKCVSEHRNELPQRCALPSIIFRSPKRLHIVRARSRLSVAFPAELNLRHLWRVLRTLRRPRASALMQRRPLRRRPATFTPTQSRPSWRM